MTATALRCTPPLRDGSGRSNTGPQRAALLGLALALGSAAPARAEPQPAPPALFEPQGDELLTLVQGQRRTERRAMGVLLGWATVNLAVGGAGLAIADDPRQAAFWGGNAAWNVVNFSIAGLALLRDRRPGAPDLGAARARADGLDRALLVNIGLDVAYLVASWGLRERAMRVESAQLLGFSDALAMQGSFLLGFDLAVLLVHQRWSRPLRGHRSKAYR